MYDDLSKPIPVEALLDDQFDPAFAIDRHELLDDAELIIGVDAKTGQKFIVFGRDELGRVARGHTIGSVNVICVAVDQTSVDLEMLLNLVKANKGRHDYVPE